MQRHFEPERLGGLEVDDKLEFGGLLDRDITGLRPAQNLVNIIASAPKKSLVVWSVGHEAPGLDKIAAWEGSGEPRAERKRGDAHAVGGNESIVHDVKCVSFGLERLEGGRQA